MPTRSDEHGLELQAYQDECKRVENEYSNNSQTAKDARRRRASNRLGEILAKPIPYANVAITADKPKCDAQIHTANVADELHDHRNSSIPDPARTTTA